MIIRYHVNEPRLQVGTTMRDSEAPEEGNMGIFSNVDRNAVLTNRQDLFDILGITPSQYIQGHQTHSDHAVEVDGTYGGSGALSPETAIEDTDALYTFDLGLVLATFSADCVPVAFWDEATSLYGIIHSGWRGNGPRKSLTRPYPGFLTSTRRFSRVPARYKIGPALDREHFEVDEDVYGRFQSLGYADDYITYNETKHKWCIDNQAVVAQQCLRAGIPADRIQVDTYSTYTHEDGFSYRKNKTSSRHMTFIYRH